MQLTIILMPSGAAICSAADRLYSFFCTQTRVATILAETWEYHRIGNNREIKKPLKAFLSGKLETDSLLQTVPALKNMVKSATVLRQEINAS
ncbi:MULTISPECIES: hypothetical protein [unclassified Microcoleus]|uniref:hypothetical protein n=1 Tax=unclassified Microcoleus TaxID=2642155 RepID=UPI002FCE7D83